MAFDGITVAALAAEFSEKLTDGRIEKIAQPEADELLLTIKKERETYRLTLSANASLPLACLTDTGKTAPAVAPNFCMLLRKHLLRAKITGVEQPHMERVLCFHLQHYNELGDLCPKKLIAEFMGKHSNLIFTDEDDRIIDSIKRIPASVSSVREVLPGRTWFIPDAMQKRNPLEAGPADFADFRGLALSKPVKLVKALYTSYTGFSPIAAEEVAHRAGLDGDRPANVLNEEEALHLYKTFLYFMEDVAAKNFAPVIYYSADGSGDSGKRRSADGADSGYGAGGNSLNADGTGAGYGAGEGGRLTPKEFSALPLSVYEDDPKTVKRSFSSVSEVIETYYASKNQATRIHQKTADLRKVTTTLLEKDVRKLELQEKQLADTEKRETFRRYGELLTAYGYSLAPGEEELKAPDFTTGEEVTVPLDPTLTAIENAKRYFEKYSKQKRTREALLQIVEETRAEVLHLQSILAALDIAVSESDLTELRAEMADSGYIRRRQTGKQGAKGAKKEKITSRPFHYISSDGIHLYVGKNNYQNEKLTFTFASGNDWWFHAKKYPGSHVIAKTEGRELPDATCEEAARLAAYYSTGRGSEKVEIDYVERKHVKKVAGAKPGFVIYHTNYSLAIAPDIQGIQPVSEK